MWYINGVSIFLDIKFVIGFFLYSIGYGFDYFINIVIGRINVRLIYRNWKFFRLEVDV